MYKTTSFKSMLYVSMLCCLTIAISSCSYKQNQVLFKAESAADTTINKGIADLPVYKIQPQDILQIRNLQSIKYITDDVPVNNSSQGALNSKDSGYQVDDDGTVALPALGRVQVAGLSRIEANRKIEDLYRKNVLKDPIIEVKLVNLKVTILGEVRSPGNYPLVNDRTSLVELIGMAGGITDKANEKNIKIIRGGTKNIKKLDVDLSNISTLSNPAIILQNQDVIYVSQNRRAIRNDNLQSLSTIIQPALVLMNTALIIFTLIHN